MSCGPPAGASSAPDERGRLLRGEGPAPPGTRLSPMASAPAAMAARRPASSVTPQILTNGRRASVAGSPRSAAGGDERGDPRGARGSAPRIELLAHERRVEPDRSPAADRGGLAQTGLRDDQAVPRHHVAQPDTGLGSTTSVRRSRLLMPMMRASVASAASSSLSSWASTSGSSPRSRAWRTSRASAAGRWRKPAGARGPRRRPQHGQLPRVDDELLGQDGQRRPPGRPAGPRRAAEPVRLHEHGDDRAPPAW